MRNNKDTGFHGRRMLYLQVRDYILEQIAAEVYRPGELIPPERELAENLKISRYTVRRALQELVEENMLYRVQGSGTYVRERSDNSGKRTNSIGIVMPFRDAETEMMLLSGMQNALRETPFSITLHTTDNNTAKETEGIRRLRSEDVAGLIILPAQEEGGGQAALALKREGFPFVLVDRRIKGCLTDCVMSDNIQGGRQAAIHLLDLGHQRIAFLHHAQDRSSSVQDRFVGYAEALQERGLPNNCAFSYDFEQGQDQLRLFLAKKTHTGVIAANGVVARDVVRVCRGLDLGIPGDLSLISFDDLSITKMLDIALTTVTQHLELMGAKAVQLLIEQIENQNKTPRFLTQHYYPTELVVRDSCRRL